MYEMRGRRLPMFQQPRMWLNNDNSMDSIAFNPISVGAAFVIKLHGLTPMAIYIERGSPVALAWNQAIPTRE